MAVFDSTSPLPPLLPRSECTLSVIHQALQHLDQASGAVKKRLLNAALVVVSVDQKITVTEAELLRAIAATLNCPIPPLLAGPVSSAS
jgi:hypothetical protein